MRNLSANFYRVSKSFSSFFTKHVMSVKDPAAMARVKDSSVAKKKVEKRTATTKKAEKPRHTALSAEKVVDSDSDEAERPTLKKARDGDNTSGKEKVHGNDVKASKSSQPEKLNKPRSVPSKVNGVKRKQSDSSSDQDESGSESVEEPPAKKTKETSNTPVKESSSSTSESDDSDDDGESSTSEDGDDSDDDTSSSSNREERASTRGKQLAKGDNAEKGGTTATSLQSIPAPPFQPPASYSAVPTVGSSTNSQFADLSGKQIWHITAPSHVPIKAINEFAISAVLNGEPVVNHKGIDYTIMKDSNIHSHDSVLFADSSGYKMSEVQVDTTLHLRQKIALPKLSTRQADENTGSQAAGDIARAAVSEVRPQPKGLRMRYKPPGFGSGEPGIDGSSSESEPGLSSRPGVQFPKALGVHGASDKPNDPNGVAKTKSKKDKKKRKGEDAGMRDVNLPIVNGAPDVSEKKGKKHKQLEQGTPQKSHESLETKTGRTETSEEKARRKEAKRLKKLAKAGT